MSDERPQLRSIPGSGSGPKPYRRTTLRGPEQATCNCTGIETSLAIKAGVPWRDDGKLKVETQRWVCFYCGRPFEP